MRAQTDSFIAELPLRTSAADERELAVRLDAARQIYNAVLGECLRVLDLMRESQDWTGARSMQKGRERTALYRAVRDRFDFKSSMADRFAIRCKNACWIGDHLSSNETQKVALRAFSAVEQYAFGVRGRPRFKRIGELHSVEGKTNQAGIRFKDGSVEWSGLRMEVILDPRDPKSWQAEALVPQLPARLRPLEQGARLRSVRRYPPAEGEDLRRGGHRAQHRPHQVESVRPHDRHLHEEAAQPAGPCAGRRLGRSPTRPLQRLLGASCS